jgi:hypothetical protein
LQGTTDLSQDGRLVEDYYFEDDKENHGRHGWDLRFRVYRHV